MADIAITVYNDDLGLVREVREVEFPKGIGEVRFTDVAARIIPTSVHFSSDNAALLEQNYEYDLVDAVKLLNKYLDHNVKLVTENGDVFMGMLLSASGDIVLKETSGIVRSLSRDHIVNTEFPDLPEGLITRPTLVWMVDSKKEGKGKAEISYLTEGMSWHAEYVAVTDKNDNSIQLTGWVNIDNQSGATYKDARLKLMAGDVQVIKERQKKSRRFDAVEFSAVSTGAPQFEEQPFYEYHLYTLQRPSTLRQNQVKQISLFPTADVKSVEKEYRIDWNNNNGKTKVTLIFQNENKNGLGIPLPKGKIRVYKEGPDGGLEFVGEDNIDHTPSNEKVKISTGNAFDIVSERAQTDHSKYENEWEIKVRNRKDISIEVVVAEHLWGDWEMLLATEGWKKVDANTIEWKIKLKPDEEKVITYRVLNK
jgi:hypothetical protein